MPDQERKQMTAWTLTGVGVVSVTLILAAMGMVLAIRQTQSLARQRIADLLPEARLIKESVHAEVQPRVRDVLDRAARNLRENPEAVPFGTTQPPVWIDETYLFGAGSLTVWHRQSSGQWIRRTGGEGGATLSDLYDAAIMARLIPPLIAAQVGLRPEPVQFAYDVVDGDRKSGV